LAPWRGPQLGERDVDQHDVAVPHHQVRRLDVAVGEPGVPQQPHEMQPFVDQSVVDSGCLAELRRIFEELGDQQVLPLRRQFDEAVRLRAGQTGIAEDT
jgi:hypothetical protein